MKMSAGVLPMLVRQWSPVKGRGGTASNEMLACSVKEKHQRTIEQHKPWMARLRGAWKSRNKVGAVVGRVKVKCKKQQSGGMHEVHVTRDRRGACVKKCRTGERYYRGRRQSQCLKVE